MEDHYPPINICMNPKFTAKGLNVYVLEQLSQFHDPIYASDYQNLIDQSVLYPSLKNLSSGMLYQLRNKLKVLVCICMYNEPKDALELTLKGIYRNMRHFAEQGITQNQIAVVLLQDGILKCDSSVIDYYEQFDINDGYQKCVIKQRISIIKQEIQNAKRQDRLNKVAQNDNFPQTIPKKLSLLYQNKWKPSTGQVQFQNYRYRINLFSCFKHLNGKKLSSHAWFFEGFCRYLKPQYCILLDVGTVPDQYGVVNLINGMQYDVKIGGVSGFMSIDSQFQSYQGSDGAPVVQNKKPKNIRGKPLLNNQNGSNENMAQMRSLILSSIPQQYMYDQDRNNPNNVVANNQPTVPPQQIKPPKTNWETFKQFMVNNFFSVQKAQEVQYIYAHMLDKNTESWMGFLHVLPGAWSGYRLSALQTGQIYQKDLLQKKYFKTIINPDSQEGEGAYKFANMYLAEDRILSLGIYCQKDKDFYLKYIPNARAKTDPMKSHYDLITQRRRWINSSNFAFEYVFANYVFDFAESTHSLYDYFNMKIGMILAFCAFINSYLIPCFYLFVLYSTIRNIDFIKNQDTKVYIAVFLSLIYVSTVVVAIGGSLIGGEWVKTIQQVQVIQNGVRKRKKVPANGPAIYITYILTVYTYFLLISVASMVASILQRGAYQLISGGKLEPLPFIIFILIIINLGSFLLILLMHLPSHPRQVWNIIKGYGSYISYQGCYTHTMLIYSFCNVDDVSWGTKGAGDSNIKKYETQKMFYISNWIFWNAIICFIFFFIDFIIAGNGGQKYVLIVIACYAGITLTIRVIFAVLNHIKFYLCCCCGKS